MKKRVLIYALKMTVGGVEKALLGQLSQFPAEKYDVTLLLQSKVGDFLDFVPDYVNVVEHADWRNVKELVQKPLYVSAIVALKRGHVLKAIYLLWLFVLSKIQKSYKPLHDYVQTLIDEFPGDYDLAIDYAGPTSFSAYFVAQKIRAKEKWTWVHFDVFRFYVDQKVVKAVYPAFDRINIVSVDGKKHFDWTFPSLASRTHVFHNIVDFKLVKKLASSVENPYTGIHSKYIICTVGRISKEKGQLMSIYSLKELIDAAYDVHWCYVGEGPDLQKCKDVAVKLGIEEYVTFVGLQMNPYPWMKYCNLYVQPSEHEGYCITLAEAKLFNLPIVSTSFTGALEQLESYKIPHEIVEYDAHQITFGIKKVLNNYQ